jgi:hypothetical protein
MLVKGRDCLGGKVKFRSWFGSRASFEAIFETRLGTAGGERIVDVMRVGKAIEQYREDGGASLAQGRDQTTA